MADMRDLALRHLVKAQREALLARQIVAADADLWRLVDVAHGAVTDAIQAVNRIPVEEASDDPYCAKHGSRFDPAVGCPDCLTEVRSDGSH